jgi:hypothetical protein
LIAGDAVTDAPVVAVNPVAGDHEYVLAPVAVNRTGPHDPSGVTFIVGNEFIVKVAAFELTDPHKLVTTTRKLFPLYAVVAPVIINVEVVAPENGATLAMSANPLP